MDKKRKGPPNARVDYRWRVDREKGFEKTSMVYDVDGRLLGIDYESSRDKQHETPVREPRG